MIVAAHTFSPFNGYGRWARSIVQCLEEMGRKVGIQSGAEIPQDMKHLHADGAPTIIVYPPFTKSTAPIQFTTYESTKLTQQMVRELKRRAMVVGLCRFDKALYESHGIKNAKYCNPFVVPHFAALPPFRPFQFIHVSADSSVPSRKKTPEVIKAFQAAFPKEDDVTLVIKKCPHDKPIPCFDSRIKTIHEMIPSLRPLYETSHVGIFPSGQEGWNYPVSDLMAMGRPCILPIYGGPMDYCDESCAYGLQYKLGPVPKEIYGEHGECAWASFEHLVDRIRWCYDNKDDVALKGALAYRRMLGFTRERMVGRLVTLL